MKRYLVSVYEHLRVFGHPRHWSVLRRDLHRPKPSPHDDETHCRAALDWLCRAQDAVAGGVSAGYFLKRGWMPPYPETTGYIIPTLIAAGLTDRAQILGDWEIEVQLPEGGVRGGIGLNDYPIVFNTGQVILGWNALYRATAQTRFLDAAVRAADWLLAVQDADGKWTRHTYLDAPRAYHSRVAWPLLQVHASTDRTPYREGAERFLRWLSTQRQPGGGYAHMALEPGQTPITHTIAYTLRGLLECGTALADQTLCDLVAADAQRLVQAQKAHLQPPPAQLPAALDAEWNAAATHSCLPGNAQLAIVLLKLYQLELLQDIAPALALIDQVKSGQVLTSNHPGLRGGVPASRPLWGAYVPYALPNWGAKFLLDALELKRWCSVSPR